MEKSNCWSCPTGMALETARTAWTPERKAATFASLRTLANAYRQQKAQRFIAKQCLLQSTDKHSCRLKSWASLSCRARIHPYLHLDDHVLARKMLQARFDILPTEDYVRCRPSAALPKLPNPGDRACYVCDELVSGVVGMYWPENLAHALLHCSHPRQLRLREEFVRSALDIFSDSRSSELLEKCHPNLQACYFGLPKLADPSALLSVMLLCLHGGHRPQVVRDPVPADRVQGPASGTRLQPERPERRERKERDEATRRRDAPQHRDEVALIVHASVWVESLLSSWSNDLRDPRCRDDPTRSPGCRLATLASRHIKRVFDTRATVLSVEPRSKSFEQRERDPALAAIGVVRPRVPVLAVHPLLPLNPEDAEVRPPTMNLASLNLNHLPVDLAETDFWSDDVPGDFRRLSPSRSIWSNG